MKTKQVAKRVLSGILAVCLVIGSIIITEPQRAQAGEINLVENGGFDTTDGWYNASGDTDVAMPEQGKEQVYEAVYLLNEDFSGESYNSYIQANGASTLSAEEGALRVTGSSAGTGVRVHNMPVVAGQTYTISFDVKIDTAGMMTNYYTRSILSSNGSATEKYYSAKALTGACDWKNVTIEYTVPEGKDCVQFIIYNNNLAADYTFWIDNLSISYEQEKVELDYAVNEDFSESNYNSYIQANGSSTLTAADGALKVSGGTGTGAGVKNVPVVAGQTYVITYDIKVDTDGLQVNSFAQGYGGSGGYSKQTYYSSYAFVGPSDWKTITVEYTVPDGNNLMQYIVYNNNATTDYTFWIDNFAIYNKEVNKVYTYSEGIGNCLGAEPDNVLAMKEMTKATYKNISLVAGKEYGYSYKVKADGEAKVSFLAGNQNVQTSATAAEWTTVAGTFTAESAATAISLVREGSGDVLIDDVEVYQITHLVSNGDFDGENVVDGWYDASGDADVAMPEQGTEPVYERVYLLNEDFSVSSYDSYIQANGASTLSAEDGALKVTGSSAGTGVRVHNKPVVAGQTYTISFDVKIDTAGMMTNYYTRSILSSNGSAIEKYYSAKALTGACDWKNVTLEYTVPEGKDCVQFIIYNNNLAADYTFWIDNLSISYEQEKEELDYAMNEDFSGSELSTYIHAFQSSTIMATDGALKVTGGVGTGAGVIGVPVVAGQTYIITYKIKVDTSGLQINSFSMDGVNNSYSGQTYYSKYAFYGPCDWKTITVEYTVPDGKNQLRYDIYNNNGIADYTFWIDDFAVYNKEANKVYTYSEGIGNCLGAEPDNVLAMKEMTKASYKNISLTAGKEYGYSYKVKADGEANVTFLAGDQKVQTSAATAEWATVSGTYTADSAATEISFTREGDGILLIDDVHVYEKTAAIEETVDVNISFRAAYPQNTWVQMQINVANEEAIAALVNGAKVDLETEIDGVKKTVSWCVDKNDSRTILYPYKATGKTIPVDAEQVKLYAGTYSVLEEGTDESLYVPFKLANDLTITKVNGTWYEGEPVDVTTTVSKKSFQISPSSDSAYQLILNTSNYAELETKYKKWTWLEGDILIDGTSTAVKGYLGGETNQFVFDYHATSNTGALIPAAATSIVIPAGTKFYASNNKDPLVIENEFKLLKLGKGWAAYTNKHEYTEGGDVRYYNIANGGYMLTSSNDAITVKELPELTTGDTIAKVGTYHVSRIENEELWEETVVLYIPGDANEDGAFTVQDLVAMKWAEAGTSEKQNARLAGTYAADMDRNGEINDIDLRALRLALVSDDAAAELAVSKADSLLGGEMPITGFGTPTSAEYITDDIYKLIAGTGINMISYCGNAYNSVGKSALADKQMQLADKYGLKMYVTDDRVTSATAYKPLTASAFATAVGAYSMYESFLGVHVVDEPSYGDVYINKEYTRPIANYAPSIALCNQTVNVSGYMNLLPYYSDTFSGGTSKYTNYLNNTFTSTRAEMLSYDHYAVRVSSGSWWDQLLGKDFKKTVKTEDFYKNLELARAQVKDTGKPFWVFAQAGAISSSSTVIDSQYWPTAAEQQWEINAALAMGARGIQYWSLFQGDTWTAGGSDYDRLGLIGADGKKNDRFYDAAASQNAFVRVVDEVLMNAGNKGVVVNDSNAAGAFTSDVKLSGYNELASVTGANALVGCFDYYGKTVLYVVNCNTSASQNITLNYTTTCKVAVTKFDAAALNRTPAASAASTTINVGAGQSALVIIE